MEYPKNYCLQPNLRLLGNRVISYDTNVAVIDGYKMIVFGKYSRTTGKHISYVCNLLSLQYALQSTETQSFYKYPMGHTSGLKAEADLISPKMSDYLLKAKRDGIPFEEAIFQAPHISLNDWKLITEHMGMPEGTKKPLKAKIEWYPLPGGPRAREGAEMNKNKMYA
jgi:hypothetical protein